MPKLNNWKNASYHDSWHPQNALGLHSSKIIQAEIITRFIKLLGKLCKSHRIA
jgi:hypothetical protein